MVVRGQLKGEVTKDWKGKVFSPPSHVPVSIPYQAAAAFVPSRFQASPQASSSFRISVLDCGKEGGRPFPFEGVLAISCLNPHWQVSES